MPAGAQPAREKKQRSILIDVVRGMAISLVVVGHTNEGLLHRGWWGASTIGQRMDQGIYAFHMPVFFFVSGIFLCSGVNKRGMAEYTLEKLRTMIYPYVVWSVIYVFARLLFAKYMMVPRLTAGEFVASLLSGHYSWFLPTLFVAVMAGMLLRKVPFWLLFALSWIAQLYVPVTGAVDIDFAIRHLPFLVLGMWVGLEFERFRAVPRWLGWVVAAGLVVLIAHFTVTPVYGIRSTIVPLGVLGMAMMLFLAHGLGGGWVARWFAWAGEASFGIFLLSEFPQGGGRELLRLVFHTKAPWPQLLIPSLLAVAIPGWLYQNRVRLKVGWLLVWPFGEAARRSGG